MDMGELIWEKHRVIPLTRRALLGLLIAIALLITLHPLPAQASPCRQVDGHKICLDQVQRSAKYHWRYRVKARVDGTPQPLTRYNCRDRTRLAIEGSMRGKEPKKFAPNGVGNLVCKLLNR